jgi:hypothetical protein
MEGMRIMKLKNSFVRKKQMDSKLQWKSIPDFSLYFVSENGHIYSVQRQKLMIPTIKGLRKIHELKCDSKPQRQTKVRLQYILASAFISNPENFKYVIFIDKNAENMHYSNLKWVSNPDNLPDDTKWYDLLEFPNTYEISIYGVRLKAKTNKGGKLLKVTMGKYPVISMVVGGNRYKRMIHILMAKQFIKNPENLPFVNHKDGNKTNWHPEILEWCTSSENMKHAKQTGLLKFGHNGNEVLELNSEGDTITIFTSVAKLAKELNMPRSTLSYNLKERDHCLINERIFCLRKYPIIEGEIWQSVNTTDQEYNSRYEVSDMGRIRKTSSKRFLHPSPDPFGYGYVALSKTTNKQRHLKTFQISRLVAFTFLVFTDRRHDVNHKDKNPSNNKLSNLEIVDAQEHNIRDHGKSVIGLMDDGFDVVIYRSISCAAKASNVSTMGIIESLKKSTKCKQRYWFYLDSDAAKNYLELRKLEIERNDDEKIFRLVSVKNEIDF